VKSAPYCVYISEETVHHTVYILVNKQCTILCIY